MPFVVLVQIAVKTDIDVFAIHDRVMDDYKSFVSSFLREKPKSKKTARQKHAGQGPQLGL